MRKRHEYTDHKMPFSYFVVMSSLALARELDPKSSAIASAVADLTRSASSVLISFGLESLSSSLSPRLNGSCSAIGDGSTVERGCHLLGFPVEPAVRFSESGASYRLSVIVCGGPSWKETFRRSDEEAGLKRLAFASGRAGGGGGAERGKKRKS
jgi:hypothetical protein